MAELYLHKRPVSSVFNLLGEAENDITYSIGWALSQSAAFLREFLNKAVGKVPDFYFDKFVISMQEHEAGSGRTDIEIRGQDIHVIIEAKRGLWLPSEAQLKLYLPRFVKAGLKKQLFVTMAECSQTYASQNLPAQVGGVPVRHFSWKDIGVLSRANGGSHAEKRLMQELRNYLTTIVAMQKQDSNMVFVVSLGGNFASNLTFIEVVEKRRKYFHPMGIKGWPKEPPNYLAFRYWGELQSIHHVENCQVIKNFHPHFPERANQEEDYALFLYDLGEPILPSRKIPTGAIYPNGRKWAMIDLLLTSKTVSDACDATKKRFEEI